MKLTRRDALIAVGAATLTTSAGYVGTIADVSGQGREQLTREDHVTLDRLAAVVYPSDVETTTEFVETYTAELHVSRRRGITAAIDDLDRATGRMHGRPFASLDRTAREDVLDQLGVNRVQPESGGTVPERIRAYLVNGLLYALFRTPSGVSLVGLENPLGYPGGYEVGLVEEP